METRVACPKFGQPVLSLEFHHYALYTEFVTAVGMLRKISIRTLDRVSELRAHYPLVFAWVFVSLWLLTLQGI